MRRQPKVVAIRFQAECRQVSREKKSTRERMRGSVVRKVSTQCSGTVFSSRRLIINDTSFSPRRRGRRVRQACFGQRDAVSEPTRWSRRQPVSLTHGAAQSIQPVSVGSVSSSVSCFRRGDVREKGEICAYRLQLVSCSFSQPSLDPPLQTDERTQLAKVGAQRSDVKIGGWTGGRPRSDMSSLSFEFRAAYQRVTIIGIEDLEDEENPRAVSNRDRRRPGQLFGWSSTLAGYAGDYSIVTCRIFAVEQVPIRGSRPAVELRFVSDWIEQTRNAPRCCCRACCRRSLSLLLLLLLLFRASCARYCLPGPFAFAPPRCCSSAASPAGTRTVDSRGRDGIGWL